MTILTEGALDAEVLPLEGIDTEGVPPCEAVHAWIWQPEFWHPGAGTACGKPSVARLHVNCGACGASYNLFLCRFDAWMFRRGRAVNCRKCDRRGTCRGRDT